MSAQSELAKAFLRLSWEDQRRFVMVALGRILMAQRGTAKKLRPKHIAEVLRIPPHPAVLSNIIAHLRELRELRVDGSVWTLECEMRVKRDGYAFYYTRRVVA